MPKMHASARFIELFTFSDECITQCETEWHSYHLCHKVSHAQCGAQNEKESSGNALGNNRNR